MRSTKLNESPLTPEALQVEFSKAKASHERNYSSSLIEEFNLVLHEITKIFAWRKLYNKNIPNTVLFYLVPPMLENGLNGFYSDFGDFKSSDVRLKKGPDGTYINCESAFTGDLPHRIAFKELVYPHNITSDSEFLQFNFGSFCKFTPQHATDHRWWLTKRIFPNGFKYLQVIKVEIEVAKIIGSSTQETVGETRIESADLHSASSDVP